MIKASQLTPEQIAAIKSWAEAGDQMADIQRRLSEEWNLSATYMDTRFLVLDLGIELQVEQEEAKDTEPEPELVPEPEAAVPGSVTVGLDEITKPGAMVSGRVAFSDGEGGMWWIDSMGRPGLDTDTAGYRPCEEDLMAFQTELRRLLEGGEG